MMKSKVEKLEEQFEEVQEAYAQGSPYEIGESEIQDIVDSCIAMQDWLETVRAFVDKKDANKLDTICNRAQDRVARLDELAQMEVLVNNIENQLEKEVERREDKLQEAIAEQEEAEE